MHSKVISIIFISLSIEVALVFGKSPKEILFPKSKATGNEGTRLGDTAVTNLSSSSAEDINGRYFDQDNSGTVFPGEKNGAYSPNGSGSFGGSGSNYPVNNNNGYNPSSGSSGSFGNTNLGNNNNGYNPSSSSSGSSGNTNLGNNNNGYNPNSGKPIGSSGTNYQGSGSNSQGAYYPGNDRPNSNNDGNNNNGYDPRPEPGTTVAFSAIRANTNSNSGNSQHIRFERTITDVGYGWNPSDSYFECYFPGTYVFSWSAVSPSNSETRLSLYENGRETGHHVWADRNGYQSASETAVLNLSRGAKVELRLTEGQLYEPSNSGRGYNTFSGFKLN